jgi:transcriptional regulator with XRE-family HTH domain
MNGGSKMASKRETELQVIGARLKKAREGAGYNRKQMAASMGITPSAYSKNEHGLNFPGIASLRRLSEKNDISMDWLLFNKGAMYHKENEKQKKELEKAVEALTKEVDRLKHELETERKGQKAGVWDKDSRMDMNFEVKELLGYMERVPMLYHEILLHFQKFKVEHKELLEASLNPEGA